MSDGLIQKRQAIQHLLQPHAAADALATYYALYHPDDRTTLVIHRDESDRADGLLALCRTGMDLFRPLLTLRTETVDVATKLLKRALPPVAVSPGAVAPASSAHTAEAGVAISPVPVAAVMIAVPLHLRPAVEAFFVVSAETIASVYQLHRQHFRPIINVLVTRAPSPGGDPRFVIREQSFDRGARPVGPPVATAGTNWRSPYFAEVYVRVVPQARGRGLGKSVVSALSNWLLERDVTPLYLAPDTNEASGRLARSLGYGDTGARVLLCDGVLRADSSFQ
jgi:GNAT superfamily N-acetyltransferase